MRVVFNLFIWNKKNENNLAISGVFVILFRQTINFIYDFFNMLLVERINYISDEKLLKSFDLPES
jgi:hypothetical protein